MVKSIKIPHQMTVPSLPLASDETASDSLSVNICGGIKIGNTTLHAVVINLYTVHVRVDVVIRRQMPMLQLNSRKH